MGNNKFNSSFNLRDPKNKLTKRNNQNPNTCFRCGSEDNLIVDFLNPEKLGKEFTEMQKISKLLPTDRKIDK